MLAASTQVYEQETSAHTPPASAPYEEALTMREAVRRAVRYSPALGAAASELDAKDAEALQAGARRNPQIESEIENFGGTGDLQGFKSAETTIGLAQVIELGGKRIKRLEVAQLDVALSGWDYEAVRLKVAAQTALSFINVMASQERRAILGEFVSLSTRFQASVAERVKAGRVSAVELSRAEVELARAKVRLAEERARLDTARRKLALQWGSQSPNFGSAAGSLKASGSLPDGDRLQRHLARHPDVARWAEEMARREAIHRLALAQGVPDLTLGAGVRQLEETQDTAVVAKVGIDLPVFNRNRGNAQAAERRITQGAYQRQAARNELTAQFVEAFGQLKAAEAKLRSLRTEVIPAATAAFDATSKGYNEGKFDLLRLIDAQRGLIESRIDIINTRAAFHKARTRVEALIGGSLYRL
jgi:cobalt-zinc-cadmium efflux system outer membrane protein